MLGTKNISICGVAERHCFACDFEYARRSVYKGNVLCFGESQ